jgi:hypothetical protein
VGAAYPGHGADALQPLLVPRSGFQWQVKRTIFSQKERRVLRVIKTCLTKRPDTVGHPPQTDNSASHMLSLKAQKSRESNAVTVAVSRGNRMTNSIRPIFEPSLYVIAGCKYRYINQLCG